MGNMAWRDENSWMLAVDGRFGHTSYTHHLACSRVGHEVTTEGCISIVLARVLIGGQWTGRVLREGSPVYGSILKRLGGGDIGFILSFLSLTHAVLTSSPHVTTAGRPEGNVTICSCGVGGRPPPVGSGVSGPLSGVPTTSAVHFSNTLVRKKAMRNELSALVTRGLCLRRAV